MSKTATDLARTAFTHVGPRSPLKQRDGAGQACLWALLKTYSAIQPYAEGPENDLMELAARTAAEGARFAAKLDAHVFGGPAADLLKTFFPQFAGLPPVSYTHLDVYKRQSRGPVKSKSRVQFTHPGT